jgi:hypothetical protein
LHRETFAYSAKTLARKWQQLAGSDAKDLMQTLASPMVVHDAVYARTPTYLRSASFDSTLVVAPLCAAFVAATFAVVNPRWYPLVLLADVWFLGYHHIVATYTRLTFNRESLKRNHFLAVELLILVMFAVAVLAWTGGAWIIATSYLYLQWFHYMRQSYGIARMYYRATPRGQLPGVNDRITNGVIYLLPIYGIAQRSATMGGEFLGLPAKPLVLSHQVLLVLGVMAAAAVTVWAGRTVVEFLRGELDRHYAAFVASHIVIFVLAYLVIDNVNSGWVAINVWHNLQYVLVVWMVNAKRFAGGVDPKARWLSTLSQPGRAFAYFATCFAISTFVYLNLNQIASWFLGGSLAATLGIYMGINFHHYLVDAVIWKRPRRPAVAAAS